MNNGANWLLTSLLCCFAIGCTETEIIDVPVGQYDTPPLIEAAEQPFTVCPEKIWPSAEAELKHAEFLILDEPRGVETAFYWRAIDNDYVEIPLESLEEQWFSPFHFGYFQENKTVGFNLLKVDPVHRSDGSSFLTHDIYYLFHEAFHFLAQDDFNLDEWKRGDRYPIQWEPRYLRVQLINALTLALQKKSSLGDAKYWYDRYTNEYAQEAATTHQTDIIEGSAQYASYLMRAIAEYGCDTPTQKLIDNIVVNIEPYEFSRRIDLESYRLGLLSGLLLLESGNDNWQFLMENGITPTETLLENVIASFPTDNPELKSSIQHDVDTQNKTLEAEISRTIDAYNNDDYYRVAFTADILGAFRTTGAYFLHDEDEIKQLTANFIGTLSLADSRVVIDGMNLLEVVSPACKKGDDQSQYIIPIHKNLIIFNKNDQVSSLNESVIFKDLDANTVIQSGIAWLCI